MIEISGIKYFDLKDVQKLTRKPFFTINYAIKAGHVKEPMIVGGNRMYTQSDIDSLNNYFNRNVKN